MDPSITPHATLLLSRSLYSGAVRLGDRGVAAVASACRAPETRRTVLLCCELPSIDRARADALPSGSPVCCAAADAAARISGGQGKLKGRGKKKKTVAGGVPLTERKSRNLVVLKRCDGERRTQATRLLVACLPDRLVVFRARWIPRFASHTDSRIRLTVEVCASSSTAGSLSEPQFPSCGASLYLPSLPSFVSGASGITD